MDNVPTLANINAARVQMKTFCSMPIPEEKSLEYIPRRLMAYDAHKRMSLDEILLHILPKRGRPAAAEKTSVPEAKRQRKPSEEKDLALTSFLSEL